MHTYEPEPGSIPLRNWNLLPIQIPELNCHHWNWNWIAIIGIELELPSLELELPSLELEFELELHSTELYSELKSDMMSLV